ncbi:ROK family protein [bacterium]|nr:ROK family protein [candidate division CSSED10-310 bacterium]
MKTKIAIGVDLGGTNLRAALVDQNGLIGSVNSIPTPRSGGSVSVVEAMAAMIADLIRRSADPVCGIGIGAPGPLDSRSGFVRDMPNLKGFRNFPLRDVLRDHLSLPVTLLNDADAAAIGEYRCGVARSWSLFCMLTLGTGLGSSVLVHGKPWMGEDGFSPELGHVPLLDTDDRCGCGGIGHSETMLSSAGLWRRYRFAGGKYRSADKPESDDALPAIGLFDLCRKGDTIAQDVLRAYGCDLGRVIITAAVSFNLRHIIVSGGISEGWDLLEQSVVESIRRHGFEPMTQDMCIRIGRLGGTAAIIGAAMTVFDSADAMKTQL